MSNPVVYSGFISKGLFVYEDNVDNPAFAARILDQQGVDLTRYNVLYTFDFNQVLNNAQSASLAIPLLDPADWVVIVGEVVGNGRFSISGFDVDGTTPIQTALRGFGNDTYPAKVYYGGTNLSTVSLVSSQDNTLFRGHVMIACSDTDPRYS